MKGLNEKNQQLVSFCSIQILHVYVETGTQRAEKNYIFFYEEKIFLSNKQSP